jgi:hypothetical protein
MLGAGKGGLHSGGTVLCEGRKNQNKQSCKATKTEMRHNFSSNQESNSAPNHNTANAAGLQPPKTEAAPVLPGAALVFS